MILLMVELNQLNNVFKVNAHIHLGFLFKLKYFIRFLLIDMNFLVKRKTNTYYRYFHPNII